MPLPLPTDHEPPSSQRASGVPRSAERSAAACRRAQARSGLTRRDHGRDRCNRTRANKVSLAIAMSAEEAGKTEGLTVRRRREDRRDRAPDRDHARREHPPHRRDRRALHIQPTGGISELRVSLESTKAYPQQPFWTS